MNALTRGTHAWPGNVVESAHILGIIARNCECQEIDDVRRSVCGIHLMLREQRVMNGLVWMRRQANRLRQEEFSA